MEAASSWAVPAAAAASRGCHQSSWTVAAPVALGLTTRAAAAPQTPPGKAQTPCPAGRAVTRHAPPATTGAACTWAPWTAGGRAPSAWTATPTCPSQAAQTRGAAAPFPLAAPTPTLCCVAHPDAAPPPWSGSDRRGRRAARLPASPCMLPGRQRAHTLLLLRRVWPSPRWTSSPRHPAGQLLCPFPPVPPRAAPALKCCSRQASQGSSAWLCLWAPPARSRARHETAPTCSP